MTGLNRDRCYPSGIADTGGRQADSDAENAPGIEKHRRNGRCGGTQFAGFWTGDASTSMSRVGSAPQAVSFSRLNAVSCPTASLCMAVGFFGPTVPTTHPYTEMWAQVRTPLRGGVLSGVSCLRGPRCIAVGQAGGLDTRTVAEVWNGVRLSLTQTPNP
jgi:hypothetical protein